VKFQEYDVGKDRVKAKEMITKSGQMSVPVIVIDDQIIIGFNQGRIDELLAKESPGTTSPVVAAEPTLPAVQTPPAAPTPPTDVKPPEA
jgi:hypothetical protein